MSWSEYRHALASRHTQVDRHKRALNDIYRAAIPPALQYSDSYQGWRFNVRVSNPDRVIAAIFGAGLFASQHYIPLTRSFGQGGSNRAEAIYASTVNLFNDLYFTADQATRVADIVKNVGIPVDVSRASQATLHE
jgi:hypothetical protein